MVAMRSLGTIVCSALLVWGPSAALANNCAPDALSGESVALSLSRADGRILLADGRVVRLAGLELASLRLPDLAGREATLLVTGAADRHGDLRADLVVEGVSLSASLLAAGHARVRPAADETACFAALLPMEDRARRNGLGLWVEPGYAVVDASDPGAVSRYAGRFAILAGRVRHVGATRDLIWVDFGDEWQSDVTIVLKKRQRARFVAGGIAPEALEGKMVRVRGVVSMRDGPRIDVTEPAAIEVVGD
jgi:hypothetical protein